MIPDISIVIPAYNQKERLRLVLAGVRAQTFLGSWEVIVVDDGSTDRTGEVIAYFQQQMPLKSISLTRNRGRCAARNMGVQEAKGNLVAFLDGDALPHPTWLQSIMEVFERHGSACFPFGVLYSLADLEFLQDPQTGSVMKDITPSVVREYIKTHREGMIVTEEMIYHDFDSIHARAKEGGYPFPELKLVNDQTAELFENYPESPIGWIGFYPHNGAIPSSAFRKIGGFDPQLSFSEGWDLAYRLQRSGLLPALVPTARTYHLYHYHGFSDPNRVFNEALIRWQAVEYMAQKHNDQKLLLNLFWQAGIWPDAFLPYEMILKDMIEFHHRFQEITAPQLDELQLVLQQHPIRGDYHQVYHLMGKNE